MDEKLRETLYSIALLDDELAFAGLYRHYFPGLLSFASSILDNETTAEDIVEEVFIKIWEKRKILPTIGNFAQYIYVAVKNTCFTYLKKNKHIFHRELGEHFEFAEPAAYSGMQQENVKIILSAVNALPPRCRLIFRMVKDEGMTYNEVATILDISERTVNAQMTIAMSRMAACLKKALPEFNVYYGNRKSG